MTLDEVQGWHDGAASGGFGWHAVGFLLNEVKRLKRGQFTPEELDTHHWSPGALSQCIKCGLHKSLDGNDKRPCPETYPFADKTEYCCECGEDYPRADLIMGEIFCPKCREEEKARKKP